MRYFLFTFLMVLMASNLLVSQIQITNTSRFFTHEQMFLANEINESGEPYAEALGYNLDDLDPFVANHPDAIAYTLGIENYEYSRYQLGTIISRSGMGLHMMWAPVIGQMAAMEPDDFDGQFTPAPNGFKEDDELIKNIMHFSMLANHAPPGHPWPQFAEFISGDPHLPQAIDPDKFAWEDFSTLRWDRSKMDKTLNPAAMGQTLMKQYLWAQDMLSGFHDADDNPIDPDGVVSPDLPGSPHFDPNNNVYYGGDGLDGFVGQVLTAEAINKVKFVLSKLAFDGSSLGAVNPMDYNPMDGLKYFPHKVAVTEQPVHPMLPPRLASLTVTDASSNLWDQVSFLWGTLSFQNMMNPDNYSDAAHLAYKSVFDGDPFPAAMSQTGMPGPYDLMKGASKVIFLNILYMHHNKRGRTFVDQAMVHGHHVKPGNTITALNAGYLLVTFAQFSEEFSGTPLQKLATQALKRQANFVIKNLINRKGRVYNSFTIGHGPDQTSTLIENQAGAIRGLLAAYQATGKARYLKAANLAYQYLIDHFYVSNLNTFRSADNSDQAVYTPLRIAALSGALREADLQAGHSEAAAIYTQFFKTVVNKMQLSEGPATGETGNDSDGDGIPYIPEQPDNLPPVLATEAIWNLNTLAAHEIELNSDATDNPVVKEFALYENYPNPFNPSTTIQYALDQDGPVEIAIFNVTGQKIRTLVQGIQTAGLHSVKWNGKNASGNNLVSGAYFYQLKNNNRVLTRKMILMK